ncbi:MAG: SGNH/GDSL hydrolase family protein [Bacteroidota bacterium]
MNALKNCAGPIIAIILASFAVGCNSNDSPPPTPSGDIVNKIMPLGASRVAGAPPEYYSYRYGLWKLLLDGGYQVDFVGNEQDNYPYPPHNGQNFDVDHEGRGGADSEGVLSELRMTLSQLSAPPDIVLFSSPGGNDGIDNYAQTLININDIIDELQMSNPNVTVFLELPAPPQTSQQTPEFSAFYDQALVDLATIAQQQTSNTSQVLTVDMTVAAGFNDSFLADDVHYNEAGAVFIANRYFEALAPVLQ